MGATDPNLLIPRLDELDHELQSWSSRATEETKHLDYVQRIVVEEVAANARTAAILAEQARNDVYAAERARDEADDAVKKCGRHCHHVEKVNHECAELHRKAAQTRRHWESELQSAQGWERKAKQRMESAKTEEMHAAAAVKSAEFELNLAQSRLRACEARRAQKAGEKGILWSLFADRCGAEKAAVAQAKATLTAAEARHQSARLELRDAEQDLRKAQRRVECCEHAVRHAKTAATVALTAVVTIKAALAGAHRALTHARNAQREAHAGVEAAHRELAATESMARAVRAASEESDGANRCRRNATVAEATAQQLGNEAHRELQYRLERLLQFRNAAL